MFLSHGKVFTYKIMGESQKKLYWTLTCKKGRKHEIIGLNIPFSSHLVSQAYENPMSE